MVRRIKKQDRRRGERERDERKGEAAAAAGPEPRARTDGRTRMAGRARVREPGGFLSLEKFPMLLLRRRRRRGGSNT